MSLNLLIVAVLTVICVCQTPPVWPNQFQIEFNESTKEVTSYSTKGKIYFDWTNKRELVTRQDGKGDRYCNTVEKFTSTPCNHFVVGGIIIYDAGKRYLDFPTKKYCCYCCNSTSGCGILKPDWMSNATFLGIEKLEDDSYEKWDVKGLQDNFYYNTRDSKRIPRRLDQHPSDVMDFKISSYHESITNSSVFNLPSYCTATCGLTTICAAIRGEVTTVEDNQLKVE